MSKVIFDEVTQTVQFGEDGIKLHVSFAQPITSLVQLTATEGLVVTSTGLAPFQILDSVIVLEPVIAIPEDKSDVIMVPPRLAELLAQMGGDLGQMVEDGRILPIQPLPVPVRVPRDIVDLRDRQQPRHYGPPRRKRW